MTIRPGKKMLWLNSWPAGKLEQVEIIARNTNTDQDCYWYIRKRSGGSDTTHIDFLFDYPESEVSQ